MKELIPVSIGEYIGNEIFFYEKAKLAKYVQNWADMLCLTYWQINNLPLHKDSKVSIKERIDLSVKTYFAERFKQPEVMAKILGRKAE